MHLGRRNRAFIPVLSVLAVGAAGVGIAFATLTVGETEATGSAQFSNPNSGAAAAATTQTVSCPTVADRLPAIPASAQAEVTRNLQLLDTQIAEANQRIINTVGQGGPNFIQNAILGPLEDKRTATLDRIAIAIGRTGERPAGLEALAACSLADGDASTGTGGTGEAGGTGESGGADPSVAPSPSASAGDNGGNNGSAAGAQTVSCPTVADKLPAIPAAAQAEVTRNLQLLDTQIAEANQRIIDTVGQGGPNFIQNAILGPLADKRVATVNRIATAIGRSAERPIGLEVLAPCTLNQ